MENTKSKLRESIRLGRQGDSSHFNLTLLTDSSEFEASQVVASYCSYGDEPDTKLLNELILKVGKRLLLPKLLPDKNLEFRFWDGDPKNLSPNGKIQEPIGAKYTGAIDLMIIPALAVDFQGNRLGQGGGSYDRVLQTFPGTTVALINENELVSELSVGPHDVPVKIVLTPTRLIRF